MKRNNTYKYSNFLKIDEDTRRDRELLNSFLLDKGLCYVGSERYMSGDYRLAFKDEILKEILQELYDEKNYEAIPKLIIPKIKAKVSRVIDKNKRIQYLESFYDELCENLDEYSDIYKGYVLGEGIKVLGFSDMDEYILDLMKRDYHLVLIYLTIPIEDFRSILQDKSFNIFKDYNKMNERIEAQQYIKERLVELNSDESNNLKVNNRNQLTVTQQIFLLDKIRNIEPDIWDAFDDTKKAKLLSLLFNKNDENIRKKLPILEMSKKDYSNSQEKDYNKVITLLNSILG